MNSPQTSPSPVSTQPQPVYWLFGRSAAGKTTLLRAVTERLEEAGTKVFCLDGDELRHGLSRDLSYSDDDRDENHRRAAEVAALAARQGIIVLVATMAPLAKHRRTVAGVLGDRLRWVYVEASLEACSHRDPKGLYQRPLGRGNPRDVHFEEPLSRHLHLHLDTEAEPVEACAGHILEKIERETGCGTCVPVSP